MRKRAEQPAKVLILRILEEVGEASVHDLSFFLQIDVKNIRWYLKILKDEKLIYISSYSKKNRGPALPIYSLGNKRDVPYPPVKHWKEKRKKKCLLTSWLILRQSEQKQGVESYQ